jgi:transposase
MRFVAVKSETQQTSAMIFKGRDLLVRQRTATTNASRGHLAEFGVIAPKGNKSSWRWRSMRVDFGQGNLVEAVVRQHNSKDGWLDEIDRSVDRTRLEELFSDVYASREGRAS